MKKIKRCIAIILSMVLGFSDVYKRQDWLEEKRMAYNNGREDRKWRIWKEAEEKVLREHGVDEATIEDVYKRQVITIPHNKQYCNMQLNNK